MSELTEKLREEFQDREYREGYDEAFLDHKIATQIRVIREQRGMTQKQLADAADMKQSRISAMEDEDYGSWSVNTLRRVAYALGVRLNVEFSEWSDLLREVEAAGRHDLERRAVGEVTASDLNAIILETPTPKTPMPMVLHCPECRARHIDVGEFATKPHHTHACQNCGLTWRPAIDPTVGVQFLPGFKNEEGEHKPPKTTQLIPQWLTKYRDQMDAEIARLRRQNNELLIQRSEQSKDYDALRQERAALQQQLRDAQKRAKDNADECGEVLIRLTAANKRIEELEREFNAEEAVAREFRTERDALQKKLNEIVEYVRSERGGVVNKDYSAVLVVEIERIAGDGGTK